MGGWVVAWVGGLSGWVGGQVSTLAAHDPTHSPLSPPPSPWLPLLLQGEQWKKTTVRTALTFPGVVSAIFLTLNFLVWGQKSSGAVPFGTLCALVFLWCGISVPLCFVGSYFGYKKAPEEVGAVHWGAGVGAVGRWLWVEAGCGWVVHAEGAREGHVQHSCAAVQLPGLPPTPPLSSFPCPAPA